MNSKIEKRTAKEFENLSSNPICGAKVTKENDNLYKWKVVLPGPKGSAYEEGIFDLSFDLKNYPFRCPEVKFITPMYHPNIKKDTGEIGSSVFANAWSPTSKIADIIMKISSLLSVPLIESPDEYEIAKEYASNYLEWEKNVRDFIKYGRINDNKKKKEEKQLIYAENEAEEEVQIYLAKKNSEEINQLDMAIKESQNINIINQIKEESKGNNKLKDSSNNIKKENINKEEEFDENYGICPITQDYMEHPVLSPSGNYYEKSAIKAWIEKDHSDPLSKQYLDMDMLVEDEEFRKRIIEYRKKYNK